MNYPVVLLVETAAQDPPGEVARSTFTANDPLPLQENWKPEAGDMGVSGGEGISDVAFTSKGQLHDGVSPTDNCTQPTTNRLIPTLPSSRIAGLTLFALGLSRQASVRSARLVQVQNIGNGIGSKHG